MTDRSSGGARAAEGHPSPPMGKPCILAQPAGGAGPLLRPPAKPQHQVPVCVAATLQVQAAQGRSSQVFPPSSTEAPPSAAGMGSSAASSAGPREESPVAARTGAGGSAPPTPLPPEFDPRSEPALWPHRARAARVGCDCSASLPGAHVRSDQGLSGGSTGCLKPKALLRRQVQKVQPTEDTSGLSVLYLRWGWEPESSLRMFWKGGIRHGRWPSRG